MSPAEQWAETGIGVAEHDGETVHASFTIELGDDAIVEVERLAVTGARPQGLVFASNHPLRIGDVADTRLVVWSDTAPPTVRLHAERGPLMFWNVWLDEGVEHAWVGAAGIRRDETTPDGRTRIVASDGHGELADDLVVELTVFTTSSTDTDIDRGLDTGPDPDAG